MVWAVYMGAAVAVRERAHLRILDGVLKLPRAIGAGIIVTADLLWLAFNILMVALGLQYLQLLWQRTFVSPALGIDQKWPQMCVMLGFLLMIVRLFQIYYRWSRRRFKGYPL
jgi:C4-dicarboxylate transporter DctQ subunit